ncbi:MAG: DUF72 domain-containing protein [Spirochaetales bacterium]|nr:DUF72 domain-containing protein [Spirochaetales bacterium]
MNTRVYIGTSGYSYEDWVGKVYPENTQKGEYFSLYTRLFSFSELNFSYYTMPTSRSLKPLADRAPSGFMFSIKAHQSLTHKIMSQWETDAKTFIEGTDVLRSSGKLGTVLFQFPYSFHYLTANRRYLDALCRCFEGLPIHIEFRNGEWNNKNVIDGLRARGAGYTASDNPDLRGLPGFLPEVTNGTGYVRFHGRNSENWWSGTNTTRYDYLYDSSELDAAVPKLLAMAKEGTVLFVAFNNHYKGKAVQNGMELIEKMNHIEGLNLILPAA